MERLEFEGFGGVRLVADAFGSPDNPAVVLLPSAGNVRDFWHGSAEALAEAGRYAICVDLRGHGDSGHAPDGRYDLDAQVCDLRAILAALPTRAFVVASGLGALIAITTLGETQTPLVSGAVLLDVNIWFDEIDTDRLREALHRRTALFDDPATIVEAFAAFPPDEPRPALTERLMSAYTRREDGKFEWRGDPRAVAAASPLLSQTRLVEAAGKIATPVTLIRGSLNQTISSDVVQRLQAIIPGSQIAEIEGAGHYAASDREDALNAILVEFLERKAPRQPLTYMGGSEPRVLRDALGCFGTGVTVVTTIDANGEPIGLTANSFTSVSLDPPLILFSLLKKSASLQTFVDAGRFAVNVLHIGQQPVAGRFATRDVARFDTIDWSIAAEGGSPILGGALASFDCSTYAVHEGGDHLIFIGEVKHAWFEPHRDPLLYFRGKYRRLHFA
ncbi:alpha/beta fold hydrolase [Sphingomonas solaris]|uniref:Alpha/beta fold hydrolase n=1 Tax=Alterirhizorhabdus solaris TaxID=2529389 RepID=A0A558RB43_9SPHN|nr:alpha/beta fold hydrolase [Sphingomonas solaris]TVV76647.1 alpha/beta fold hydrolase [Sphingomonas solaris]